MMDALSGSSEWFVQLRSDREYGCWRPYVNNKFLTSPKSIFFVKEGLEFVTASAGFLAII